MLQQPVGPSTRCPRRNRGALGHPRGPSAFTAVLNGRRARGVTSTDTTVPGPAGDLPVRLYRPAGERETALPVVMAFHSGGWMLGNLDTSDWLCSNVAAKVQAVVVAVDHRLAPEVPAPAALDDCYTAP